MRALPAVVVALSACHAEPARYAGAVDGTDAVVGMVLDVDGGRMYACGGPDTMDQLDAWFDVSLDGDALTGAADGWSVDASRDGEAVRGTLGAEDGTTWDFTASRGTTGPEGPYEAEEAVGDCPVGVVVLEGGDRVQGVACPAGLAPAQVVPMGVVKPGATRISVEAEGLAFVVVPVEL